jgi:hypothetical protein
MMLLLKGKQLQAGADWDSMISISVGLISFAAAALLVGLVLSRLMQKRRLRGRRGRPRRRLT